MRDWNGSRDQSNYVEFIATKELAGARGFSTAHEYLAYRTALRADYAAVLRIPDRAPATYLPLLNAFRSSTRTAE